MRLDDPSRREFLVRGAAAVTGAAIAPAAFAATKNEKPIDPNRPAAAAGRLLIGGDLLVDLFVVRAGPDLRQKRFALFRRIKYHR